ncbi:MAG TPA: LysR family transcriptional regulator [Methylovirgula sp.]|nr:LysR family transcriptional regulator [Methylovirgula sp.]
MTDDMDETIPEPHPFDTEAPSITRRALDHERLLSGDYWGELRTFLWVAKAGSLSRAAELLGSSHATVGREIRRLQDQMGSQLVILTKNGANLTQKGRALTAELLRLDQRLFSIANDLRAEKGEADGTVRLGITDGLGVVFLVPELRRFSTQYPRIQVHMKSPGNFKNLRENQTDVILGFSPDSSHDMTCRALGWLHFLPIASQSYVERMGVPTHANVQKHHFVDSEIYSAKGAWDSWHALINRGTLAHFCDASISYAMMIKVGLGIGLLANYTMMEPAFRPLDLDVHIRLRLHAIALTERLEAKPVRLIFTLLEKLFGPQNPWFQERMVLSVNNPVYREDYAMLFNS